MALSIVVQMFEKCLMEKYGPSEITAHYMAFDTICDATQERQDAMLELVEDDEIDLMIVVGGWDSRYIISPSKFLPIVSIEQSFSLCSNTVEYRSLRMSMLVCRVLSCLCVVCLLRMVMYLLIRRCMPQAKVAVYIWSTLSYAVTLQCIRPCSA